MEQASNGSQHGSPDQQDRSARTGDCVQLDTDAYQRVLGEELRKLRKARGWTRKDLGRRLQTEVSLQTLATYELGTRQCSVVRLVELCLALGEQPDALLGRVHSRMFAAGPDAVRVELAAIGADQSPELEPLRRWAKRSTPRTGDDSTQASHLELNPAALDWLAELCGLSTAALLAKLNALPAASVHRRKSWH